MFIDQCGRRRLVPQIPRQPNLDKGPSGVCPSRLDREREIREQVEEIGTAEQVADILDDVEKNNK